MRPFRVSLCRQRILQDLSATRSWIWPPDTIDIVLLDRPDLPPSGAGEASIRPVAAAIGNAIFDATNPRAFASTLARETHALSGEPLSIRLGIRHGKHPPTR